MKIDYITTNNIIMMEHNNINDINNDIDDLDEISNDIETINDIADDEIDNNDDNDDNDILEDGEYNDCEDDYDNDGENDDNILSDYISEEDVFLKNTINKITNKKKTFNIMTIFEKNYILGIRTQQIINGSVVLVDIKKMDKKTLTPYNIALEELKQKKIPFKIKRKMPDGSIEHWDIKDFRIF